MPENKPLSFYEWYIINWDWKRPTYMEDLQEIWDAAQASARQEDAINMFNLTRKR